MLQRENKMELTPTSFEGRTLLIWGLVIFDFLHHDREKVEGHLVWKLHKKNSKEKLVNCDAEVARLYRVSLQSCTQNRPSSKVQSLS